MADLFNTRNLSFHTPKSQWDPIIRYYNAILFEGERRNIDLLPQVRVEPVPGEANKFVVQWSLGGFGDPIPGTPLREYNPPNLQQINEWLYSMEGTDIEADRPYDVKSDGVGFNFPREIHNFALEALTPEGEIVYLAEIDAENVNDPNLIQALRMPYWGPSSNRVPMVQWLVENLTAELQRQQEILSLGRLREADEQLIAEQEEVVRQIFVRRNDVRDRLLPEAIEENNNRPFWRVLREGSGGIITPDSVAIVYNQNNPPPNPLPQPYISPRTIGEAVSTIYQMLSDIRNIDDEQRQQNNELLARAVREQIGVNLETRIQTILDDNIASPIKSEYVGAKIETPFIADGKSAGFLQIDNMTELTNTEYGLTQPVYNRYLPSLEAADSFGDIHENNLVNFYTLMGSINTEVKDGQVVPSGWNSSAQRGNYVYSKYKNLSTLSGSVDDGLLDIARQSISRYYASYMNAVDELEPGTLNQMSSVFKRAKFPDASSTFLSAYDFNQTLMPYYIAVNFKSGETGEVVESINENRLSSYILDKTQKSEDLMENEVYTVSSDLISVANRPTTVTKTKDINIRQRNFRQVMATSLRQGISDLTFNVNGKEAITGDVAGGDRSRQISRLLQTVQRESTKEMLSYVDRVENKHFSNTESVSDVIVKKPNGSNEVMAKTYIAAPSIPESFNYTDTQVKYKEIYNYEINRYQIAYGTHYAYKTIDITVPFCLNQVSQNAEQRDVPRDIYINYQAAGDAAAIAAGMNDDLSTILPDQVVGYSFCVEVNPAEAQMIELPVYSPIYNSFGESVSGVSFAPVSVRDYPPTPPVLEIQPIRDNFRQVLVNINLEAVGRSTTNVIDGPQCLEGTDYQNTYDYQKMFIDFTLPEDKLVFQNDGLSEITNVTVVRTDKIVTSAYEVEDPYEAYKSFCQETNPEAEIMRKPMTQDFGQVGAGSYGFLDDILPNKYYYYTAYCKDLRENVSNPSDIYQVRLVYDKGFLVPEIGLLNIESVPNKVPVKKMTRFLEIRPSSIQTQPFMERNEDDELISYKSLIRKAGDAGILENEQEGTVTNNDFIVRITSKDTGRKFDIRLKVKETNPVVDDRNNPGQGDL